MLSEDQRFKSFEKNLASKGTVVDPYPSVAYVKSCIVCDNRYFTQYQIQNISPDGLPFYFTDKANTWSNGASSACQRLEYQKQIADSLVFRSLILPCQVGGRAFSRVLIGLLFWF